MSFSDLELGLIAVARVGDFEVSLDEATSGEQRHFLTIETSSVYVRFEVSSSDVIKRIVEFIRVPDTELGSMGFDVARDQIDIGASADAPVLLLRDIEFSDRFIIHLGALKHTIMHIMLSGDATHAFEGALREVMDQARLQG